MNSPLVGVVMGSTSDWDTMTHAADVLSELEVPFEVRVVSAHRTPDLLFSYAEEAERRGLEVIIAGAGGAAHLPGMLAAKTGVPILGVPVQSKTLSGMDSLLSIVQMPAGIPVGTLAIGRAGAVNAGLLAAAIVGNKRPETRAALARYRARQTESVLANPDPRVARTLDAANAAERTGANERTPDAANAAERTGANERTLDAANAAERTGANERTPDAANATPRAGSTEAT